MGTRSYAMARRLLARGHQVTMVCGSYMGGDTGLSGTFDKGIRRGIVEGIEVVEFELPYSNRDAFMKRIMIFLKFAWKSVGFALKEEYDIIVATSTPLTAGIPGIAATFLRRKPFVFEVRDLWPELPKSMGVITNPVVLELMSLLEWLSYHSARGCIGLAPGIVKGIERRGIRNERIAMVPNGCDLDLFSNSSAPAWRPEGVLENDLMAVFTGTHGIANGLDSVLDAADVLLKRGRKDIKFVLIGDGKLKPELMARASKEGLTNCIFHKPVPKTLLSGLMNSADVGLMVLADCPSFYYGTSPNKFFDYIAAGIPVVNNYPGWVADMIMTNGCGIAISPRDPSAFADALEWLANNPEALARMGKAGRQLAEREFDRDHLSNRWVDFLEGIYARG